MNSNTNKERSDFYKSKNICSKCGKRKAAINRFLCFECLEKDNDYSKNYYRNVMTLDKKEEIKRRNKRKKSLCVAFKVCVNCMKRDATNGQFCLECWLKSKRRNEKKSSSIKRSERKEYELCYFCEQPVMEGKKTCVKCYERTKISMLNVRKLRGESND